MERPELLIFDVNETLSDMAPLADRFQDVGAAPELADTWFSGLLRDGFALTVNGVNPEFAGLAREHLSQTLAGVTLARERADAVDHVMAGISELRCHADVVEGVRALSRLGIRLVTLSNGSATIARRLLNDAGVADLFEQMLSVEDAPAWKPEPRAYAHALDTCGVPAAGAMLVAVHPWDTDGARRAGLSAAWINRASGGYPTYFLAPNVEAHSLVDLATTLD
jgi:2-haloacid dehalogenase